MTAMLRLGLDLDMLYFEGLLPAEGRIQTVGVRDVARAFVAATTAVGAVGRTLFIGGDATHRMTRADVGAGTTKAFGLMGRSAGWPYSGPGQPRRLVRHRLDGHHAGAGSA